ncbi:MAG TPA: hypothetical protein VF753_15705 [Terriglobales bacterium]
MKPLAAAILLASFAFAQADKPTVPPTSPATVDQQNSQKAKALIDQAIQALGGQAYLNIQDISAEGRAYSFHMGESEGVGVQFWLFYKYPDKSRIELTKKRDVIYITNGNSQYEITYKGTRADDPKAVADTLRRRQYALDFVLREWIKQPGIAYFYEGSTVAAQKDTQRVTIMTADNQSVTLWIDTQTHLPVKKSYSWRDPTDQQRNVEDEVYDAYRQAQGVMTPYSVTRFYNGDMSSQRFFTSIVYNKGLSESLFSASITYDPNKQMPRK